MGDIVDTQMPVMMHESNPIQKGLKVHEVLDRDDKMVLIVSSPSKISIARVLSRSRGGSTPSRISRRISFPSSRLGRHSNSLS